MYGIFGFVEKLNIQNFVNSVRNSVHYIHTEHLDLQRNWITKTTWIQREIVYIINVQNVCICIKIENLELRKFNGKLCTLNVWTIWICRYIENPEMQKFDWKLCTLNVRNVRFCGVIEYPKYRKFSRKLSTLYMYGMFGFAEKLNILNNVNSTGNCVH